ncbi:MAG: bifunctional folylpolyglutamate synthase/dihydrofolate synthase [Alphaproteobacteria bacterium]|nr:bifunctional folylpolyglutamate synthase/dihydrofolate synthase [Alphaproteobacteria bacterium]
MITHPVLSRLAMSGVKLGLDRVREFLQVLGEPQRAYAVVHVAGTNGKGSVTSMVAHALREAGYRVGANFSPHTSELNERIWIDGAPVSDAFLSEVLEAVDRARQEWAATAQIEGEPLTYFELVTCAAFVAFARRQVDIAVIETGLGGRLDATNVVQPQVVAVTSVSMDHMAELGDNLVAIAGEKAGIFKKGATAVVGPMEPTVMPVFVRRAEVLGMELWKPGTELRRSLSHGRWTLTSPHGTLEDVEIGLQGEHQGANASVALGVLHQLRQQGFPIDDDAIRRGLEKAWMPGRLEEVAPGIWVDGAHNPGGAEALAKWLSRRPRPDLRILIFGMGEGRNPVDVAGPLVPYVDELVTTKCAHPKARDPYDLAVQLQDLEVVLSAGSDIETTLPEVAAEADEVIVAGSLYLAGAVRTLVAEGVLDEPFEYEEGDEDEGGDED